PSLGHRRRQPGRRLRVRALLSEWVVIVGVRAAIGTNVGAIVARAADSGIIVAKMSPAHVEIGSVDESIFFAIKGLPNLRKKGIASRMRGQGLRAKGRGFID